MRSTFNPIHSNLNVHLDREAYNEFVIGWPEARHEVKGLDPSWAESKGRPNHIVGDARHAPPYVSMSDLGIPEGERHKLISQCDVNQNWSAMICVVNGELRGFFCEIAGAMAMLHQSNPAWQDLGVKITPGWWKKGMDEFRDQVRWYCHRCGIPMKGHGELAIGGTTEQVSETHRDIYRTKSPLRKVELVTLREQLKEPLERATDYIQNGSK
jgi:hypothetical protein